MILEYVVFVSLLVFGLVIFILDSRRPKEKIILDPERMKCESPIESRLYLALKHRGEYVRTQVPCGRYSIDIALPGHRIAIECDGAAYHSTKAQKAHDRAKDKFLKANGWKVLRFTGKRIYKDLNGIIKRIEKEKGLATISDSETIQK